LARRVIGDGDGDGTGGFAVWRVWRFKSSCADAWVDVTRHEMDSLNWVGLCSTLDRDNGE